MEAVALSPLRVRGIVKIPNIAWPTVVLAITASALQLFVALLLHQNRIRGEAAVLINTAAVFMAFTPLHDASHGSVAVGDWRILNFAVGYLMSWSFPLPFSAFRHLHLLHHRYTNEDGDPDMWAGTGAWYLLPLRWMTIEWCYYSIYLPRIGSRPIAEAAAALAQLGLMGAVLATLFCTGHARVVLLAWLLPGRLALFLLAFFFDYLPHRPHSTPRSKSVYRATHVIALVGDWTWPLTWPLLHQNYHNVHHLAPFIPFYQYSAVWNAIKEELLAKGTRIVPILSLQTPHQE